MTGTEIKAILEALIFASPDPLTPKSIYALLASEPREDVDAALDELRRDYDRPGGLQLVELAGGLQIVTRPEMHEWVRRLFGERTTQRLSVQALETLAVIAYRQPITAAEITDVRGVNTSGVLNTLLERHLIKIVGRKQVVGRPFMYATTKEFLIRFGLKDLSDLPKVEDMAEALGLESTLLTERSLPDDAMPLHEPDEADGPEVSARTGHRTSEEPGGDPISRGLNPASSTIEDPGSPVSSAAALGAKADIARNADEAGSSGASTGADGAADVAAADRGVRHEDHDAAGGATDRRREASVSDDSIVEHGGEADEAAPDAGPERASTPAIAAEAAFEASDEARRGEGDEGAGDVPDQTQGGEPAAATSHENELDTGRAMECVTSAGAQDIDTAAVVEHRETGGNAGAPAEPGELRSSGDAAATESDPEPVSGDDAAGDVDWPSIEAGPEPADETGRGIPGGLSDAAGAPAAGDGAAEPSRAADWADQNETRQTRGEASQESTGSADDGRGTVARESDPVEDTAAERAGAGDPPVGDRLANHDVALERERSDSGAAETRDAAADRPDSRAAAADPDATDPSEDANRNPGSGTVH